MFNPLNALLGLFSLDIGIDLGTANTLVNVRGKGIIINEPSWVAIEKKTRKVLAIGSEAKEMVGRTPANIVAIRPLRDGVISDFEITEKMIHYFIGKVHDHVILPIPRPRVVVGIPNGCTEVEKRAAYDATVSAGAREAYLIEEPMAAALGAGLPITEAMGSMMTGHRPAPAAEGTRQLPGRRREMASPRVPAGRRRDGRRHNSIRSPEV